jgi:hypothetical protein
MATSRNAIANPKSIDLEDRVPEVIKTPDTPGDPITGNQVVPCSWQKTLKDGPMIVAGDRLSANATIGAVSTPIGHCWK